MSVSNHTNSLSKRFHDTPNVSERLELLDQILKLPPSDMACELTHYGKKDGYNVLNHAVRECPERIVEILEATQDEIFEVLSVHNKFNENGLVEIIRLNNPQLLHQVLNLLKPGEIDELMHDAPPPRSSSNDQANQGFHAQPNPVTLKKSQPEIPLINTPICPKSKTLLALKPKTLIY